jgi:hypothetical protein
MTARVTTILLGVWLFMSTFLWRHHPDQVINGWVCGLFTIMFAAMAIAQPMVRFLGAAFALWIFFSAWVVPSLNIATVFSNAISGALIFGLSMAPNQAHNESGIPRPRTPAEV